MYNSVSQRGGSGYTLGTNFKSNWRNFTTIKECITVIFLSGYRGGSRTAWVEKGELGPEMLKVNDLDKRSIKIWLKNGT